MLRLEWNVSMLLHVENILSPEILRLIKEKLESDCWADGKITAGEQSSKAKNNLQITHESSVGKELGEIILRILGEHPTFNSAVLPLRVFPPLFNRYDAGMHFHAHVDNAIRKIPGVNFRIRTDVSCTIFLNNPDDYVGGELIIQDTYGEHSVKLPAGDMIIYPSTSLHRVLPVTQGSRWASFFWCQSMIKDDTKRTILYEFDRSIMETRKLLSDDHKAVLGLTSTYHNLMRQWCEI